MANYYDKEVKRAQKKYKEAKAKGDKKGMREAHKHAEKMRKESSKYEKSKPSKPLKETKKEPVRREPKERERKSYQEKEIERAQQKWKDYQAKGDKKGMQNAHAYAEKMRKQVEQQQASKANRESTQAGWHSSEMGPRAGIPNEDNKLDFSRDTPNQNGLMKDVYGFDYSRNYTQGSDGNIYGGTRRIDSNDYARYQELKRQGKLGDYAYDNAMYRDPFGETVDAMKQRGLVNPSQTEAYEIVDQSGQFQNRVVGKDQAQAMIQNMRNAGMSEEQIARQIRSTGKTMDAYNKEDSNLISKYVNQRNHADSIRGGAMNNPYAREVYEKAYEQGLPRPPEGREWTIDDYREAPNPKDFIREGEPQGEFPQGLPQGLPQGYPGGFPQGLPQGLPQGQGLPNFGLEAPQGDFSDLSPFQFQTYEDWYNARMKGKEPQADNSYLLNYQQAMEQQKRSQEELLNKSIAEIEKSRASQGQAFSDNARQAYVANLMSQKRLGEQMNYQGLGGGATESALSGMESAYQNALAKNNIEKANAMANIDNAINQTRSQSNAQIAEIMSNYQRDIANAKREQDNQLFNRRMQMKQQAMDEYNTERNNAMDAYNKALEKRKLQYDVQNDRYNREMENRRFQYGLQKDAEDRALERQKMAQELSDRNWERTWKNKQFERDVLESDRRYGLDERSADRADRNDQWERERWNREFGLKQDKYGLQVDRFAYQKAKAGRRGGGRRSGTNRSTIPQIKQPGFTGGSTKTNTKSVPQPKPIDRMKLAMSLKNIGSPFNIYRR